MPTSEIVQPRFVKKKNQQFRQEDYPRPECGVHLANPEHSAEPLLLHLEGPHRPARAILRRVSFLFQAIIAFAVVAAPPTLHPRVFGHPHCPCLIETSSSASATQYLCPISSGAIIVWSRKVANTSAFAHSTTTRSHRWPSMNDTANGDTNALLAARAETASRT